MLSVSLILLALAMPPVPLQPVSFDIHDQLYSHGYSTDFTWMVRRNSAGSRVYLYEWPKARGLMIVEGGRVVRQMQRPAERAFLNDDEQFVAWSDDLQKGVAFIDGSHRDLRSGEFDVDPGGNYFVIGGGYGETSEIAAIAHPMRTLALTKVEAQRIFANDDKVYLLGLAQDRSLVCQTYIVTAESAALIDEQTIAKPFHEVLDMDPTTEACRRRGGGRLFGASSHSTTHGPPKLARPRLPTHTLSAARRHVGLALGAHR
jgi:hypothetical protein